VSGDDSVGGPARELASRLEQPFPLIDRGHDPSFWSRRQNRFGRPIVSPATGGSELALDGTVVIS
jgi:hypothetical protein